MSISDFGPAQRDQLRERAGALFGEIAANGSLSRDDERVRDDADSLALLIDLGLVADEGDRLVAVDPALVQQRLVAPLTAQAAAMLSESSEWASTFADLGQVFRRRSAGDEPVTEVRGYANINRFLTAVVDDAETELLTAQPSGARSAATLEVAIQRDQRALQRGLSMRTLYQHSARRSIATQEYVARVGAHGAEVRTLDEFFNRLIVVDRRLAIVPAAESTEVAVVIHDANLVAYLADIFERYWERATAFTDRESSTQRQVADDVHNMTVRMLIEGHSDHASAKRMGVSTRTYAGYVAALKEEYDAESRFQLGHIMGRRRIGPTGVPEADDEAPTS